MKKFVVVCFSLYLCANAFDLKDETIHNNQAAYITSECYTKTVDSRGRKHNPCYACHINSKEPNYTNDEDLQASYDFPEYATKNHFTNLFKDRTKEVKKISDSDILKYVKQNNYKNLAYKLKKHLPKNWDVNGNGKWDGYILDCNYHFDPNGFDRDMYGNLTGWVAFSYRPFLGTFWPTNGSTDDVLIRLPKKFWKDKNGKIDTKIYKANLNILKEQMRDSADNYHRYFVGLAKDIRAVPRLYPVGTEFLHSVRYIDIKNGKATMAKRMKELRYAKKVSYLTYSDLKFQAGKDAQEVLDNPDELEVFRVGNAEKGLYTKGWFYQGFIEDKKGELRPQNYEETLYCIGCHSGIGATTDTTFAFPRAFGWKWMGNANLKIADKDNEYKNYLLHNASGDEFRDNYEVLHKFFTKDFKPKKKAFERLKNDISYLLMPSAKRALKLDKAYKVIVDEQSYIYGREGHIKPFKNVYKKVKQAQSTKLDVVYKKW